MNATVDCGGWATLLATMHTRACRRRAWSPRTLSIEFDHAAVDEAQPRQRLVTTNAIHRIAATTGSCK